jgi:hypothetical protein
MNRYLNGLFFLRRKKGGRRRWRRRAVFSIKACGSLTYRGVFGRWQNVIAGLLIVSPGRWQKTAAMFLPQMPLPGLTGSGSIFGGFFVSL